jgi:hypothetical protein
MNDTVHILLFVLFPFLGPIHIPFNQGIVKFSPPRQTAPTQLLLVVIYRHKNVSDLVRHFLSCRLVKVPHLVLLEEQVVLVFVVLSDLVNARFVEKRFLGDAHFEQLKLVFEILLFEQVLFSPD